MMNDTRTGLTVEQLAAHVGDRYVGDGAVVVDRIADLRTAEQGTIAFIENQKRVSWLVSRSPDCSQDFPGRRGRRFNQ